MSNLQKRSVRIGGHVTSIALEPEFWQTLEDMASTLGIPLIQLLTQIDAERELDDPLASRLRVAALVYARTNSSLLAKKTSD